MIACKSHCVINIQEAQVAIPCHPEMIITQKSGKHHTTSILVHHLQDCVFCEYCSPMIKVITTIHVYACIYTDRRVMYGNQPNYNGMI